MTCPGICGWLRPRRSSSLVMGVRPAFSSASSPKTTGSSTVWSTTRSSYVASVRPVPRLAAGKGVRLEDLPG